MLSAYQHAIIDEQYKEALERSKEEGWQDISLNRHESFIYARFTTELPKNYTYLCRIDMSRYPVDPYWIGFINPDLPNSRWDTSSDCDQRFWPWSPMPGLHGSFILAFQGPFRTFWCRDCNFPFFIYHSDHVWYPGSWRLSRVIASLRDAIRKAEPPSRWRPLQRETLVLIAGKMGFTLPDGAGSGAK